MNDQKTQEIMDLLTDLQRRLAEISAKLDSHNHDGNNSSRVNFSDLFSVSTVSSTYPTSTTTIGAGGGSVTFPTRPSGTLPITIGNKTYNIPFQ